MCYSVKFVEKTKNFDFLRKLLIFLNADKYQWVIGDSDIYSVPELENLFENSRFEYTEKTYKSISGKELLLKTDKPINYVFIELFAFDSEETVPEDFDEFLSGECKYAVIIDDCNYYSVYMKDSLLFNDLIQFLNDKDIDEYTILDKAQAEHEFNL